MLSKINVAILTIIIFQVGFTLQIYFFNTILFLGTYIFKNRNGRRTVENRLYIVKSVHK